jgi:hypothetical protein
VRQRNKEQDQKQGATGDINISSAPELISNYCVECKFREAKAAAMSRKLKSCLAQVIELCRSNLAQAPVLASLGVEFVLEGHG